MVVSEELAGGDGGAGGGFVGGGNPLGGAVGGADFEQLRQRRRRFESQHALDVPAIIGVNEIELAGPFLGWQAKQVEDLAEGGEGGGSSQPAMMIDKNAIGWGRAGVQSLERGIQREDTRSEQFREVVFQLDQHGDFTMSKGVLDGVAIG